MEIIDITKRFFSADVYPGDPRPEAEQIAEIGDNSECNLTVVHACVHNGTHADAPSHFLPDGITIDEMTLDAYIGPCKVIEVPDGVITGEYVDEFFPKDCKRLLVKSGGRAYFMDSSAQELAERGLLLIGTDSLSVGTKGNQTGPHRAFLGERVAILEGLELTGVEPGDYFLFAPPVPYDGLDGAPVRAVLISDYIFWSK